MTRRHLLVTGPARSGTTLLARLLDGHPQTAVASQPFPLLYVGAKAAFFASLGHPGERFPLGDLFCEDRYRPEDLDRFLDGYRPGRERLGEIWSSMESYSGRQTEVPLPGDAGDAPSFDALFRRLHDASAGPDPEVAGSKEVLVEEYLPYLVGRGILGVLCVRDPRDVIASSVSSGGRAWVGRPRPLLFLLRNWRRAATVAAALDGTPGFAVVRFEDLVAGPDGTLGRLAGLLGVAAFAPDAAGRAVAGWRGNSSFGDLAGVSDAAVGRHRSELDEATVRYVETVCGPEMDLLGYHRSAPGDVEAPAGYREPWPLRDDVDPSLSRDPGELALEAQRLRLLASGAAGDEEQRRFFRYPAAYRRLAGMPGERR
jgi:hypothetical protein